MPAIRPVRPNPSPVYKQAPVNSTVSMDIDTFGLQQKNVLPQNKFYNDHSQTTPFKLFQTGLDVALNFASATDILRRDLVTTRTDTNPEKFRLTTTENAELQAKAFSMASYGNVPVDDAEDFLYILCYVDNIEDMTRIADAVQVSELANPAILRQPMEILSLSGLNKVAYMASAVASVIKTFSKYSSATSAAELLPHTAQPAAIIDSILISLGGFGALGQLAQSLLIANSIDTKLSLTLSDLLLGKKIPMNVVANNPMMAGPSYVGQRMFGEYQSPLAMTDTNMLFPKFIGAFPAVANGGGVSSFGFQNFGSFGSGTSLSTAINMLVNGTTSIPGDSYMETFTTNILSQVSMTLNVPMNSAVEMKRSDNAIPVMIALGAALAGQSKCPFPTGSLQQAWILSNGVASQLQSTNPGFLEAVRKLS